MLKKVLPLIMITLVVCSVFSAIPTKASAYDVQQDTEAPQTLDTYIAQASRLLVTMQENLKVLENGSSELSLFINVPPSPLAEMYRRFLGAPSNASCEEIVPIPESVPLSNDTNLMLPVRKEFYKSMEQQQQSSFGIEATIFDSSMMPRSNLDEFRLWLSAEASLPIADVTSIGSSDEWKMAFGPKDENATASSIFTNIQLVQMMLASLPGEQVYECLWTTRIELPPSAVILDTAEFSRLYWVMDLGGGTCVSSFVTLEGAGTIVLNERTIVTEGETRGTSESSSYALSRYRVFDIEFLLPHSSPLQIVSQNATCVGDWSRDWTQSWTRTESYDFPLIGPLEASLTATANLTLSGHIAWDFDWWRGLSFFESWMQVETSLELGFFVGAVGSYAQQWSHTFFTLEQRYWFWVPAFLFPVLVWVDLRFDATGTLAVTAFGKIGISAGAKVASKFKAGVRWTRESGWREIKDSPNWTQEYTEPTIVAEAGASLRAGLNCRLSFLFYDVAGPFVEFEPYATATAACRYVPPAGPEGSWEIAANFRVAAGATFAGWIKTLIGLRDWAVTLLDRKLWSWSGTWTYSGPPPPVDNTQPGPPGKPVPDGFLSASGNVTWTWTPAIEDVGVITQYQLQVETSPGENDTFDGYVGVDLNKSLSYLIGNNTYYARVRAQNAADRWGPWSEVSDGVLVDRPPVTFIIDGPSGITSGIVSFKWTGIDDVTPTSDLVYSYRVEGYDSDWSPWTSLTGKDYTNLPSGNYTFKVRVKDQHGTIGLTVAERPFEIVQFSVEFDPNTLNLKGRGNWIRARIKLPQDYSVADVDISTIVLNDAIWAEPEPTSVANRNSDTVSDLVVMFNRTQVVKYMLSKGIAYGNVTLTMKGWLTTFAGKAIVAMAFTLNTDLRVSSLVGDVNCDGTVDIYDATSVCNSYGSREGDPDWNPNANFAEEWDRINLYDVVTLIYHYGQTSP